MTKNAMVRIIHLSPDAPNVNITVDGMKILENLGYTSASEYLELEPGTHTVTVSLPDGTTVLGPIEVTLESDTYYTITATGLAKGEPAFRLVIFTDWATGAAA